MILSEVSPEIPMLINATLESRNAIQMPLKRIILWGNQEKARMEVSTARASRTDATSEITIESLPFLLRKLQRAMFSRACV